MNFLAKIFSQTNQVKKGILTSADREQVRERWEKIVELENINKPSTLREAVIEADKLVDFALSKLYPQKEKAADRLREAKSDFLNYRQDYEDLWYSHKIRNELVHTVGFELPSTEAKNVLDNFKRALEILGAL
jgi:hypothetical protein